MSVRSDPRVRLFTCLLEQRNNFLDWSSIRQKRLLYRHRLNSKRTEVNHG